MADLSRLNVAAQKRRTLLALGGWQICQVREEFCIFGQGCDAGRKPYCGKARDRRFYGSGHVEVVMAGVYSIGFEEVTLLSGTSQDRPMWLWMEGKVFKRIRADDDAPLWVASVGGLPQHPEAPDVETTHPEPEGRYADRLPYNVPMRAHGNPSSFAVYSLPSVAVLDDEELHLRIILAPRLQIETFEIDPDRVDQGALMAFFAAAGFFGGGGIPGLGISLISGIASVLGGNTQEIELPCVHAAIMGTLVFSAGDLAAMNAEGLRTFMPSSPPEDIQLCKSDARCTFVLSANRPSFGSVQPIESGPCVLRPRAAQPVSEALEGFWGDTDNQHTSCINVAITLRGPESAIVYVSHGVSSESNPFATYEPVKIEISDPEPDFQQNFNEDDTCPIDPITPACPQCRYFSNLGRFGSKKWWHFGHVLAGMKAGTHAGMQPAFPIVWDTRKAAGAKWTPSLRGSIRIGDFNAGVADQASFPAVDERANRPLFMSRAASKQAMAIYRELGDFPFFVEQAWTLRCSDDLTLYGYWEFKNGRATPCARLRFVKRDSSGRIITDVMLRRIIARPR